MKRDVIGVVVLAILLLAGCQEEGSDERLIDVAVKQDEHTAEIGRMARKIEGISNRLEEIEESLGKVAPPSGAAEPTKSTEPTVVEFKDTPEYKRISGELAAIGQQLNNVQGGLARTQEAIATERAVAQRQDPAAALRAMNDPTQLSERLGTLAANFSQKIEDPLVRQQFELEVEQFKRKLLENRGTEGTYERVVNDLTARLNSTQDKQAQERIQREIDALASASGEELQGRLDRYTRFDSFRQLRSLAEKYNIPREVMTESGLIAVGGRDRGGERAPRGGEGSRRRGGGR